jgi:ubiquinone/menaquinone biosynthesis C-methylase UbiE
MSHDHSRMFSHENASRLDSPERLVWLPTDEVLNHLEIEPGMTVADIGTGTGYFALPIADRVGARGRVHAVDIQPEMLAMLEQKMPPGTPIDLVRGTAEATGLTDATQDLVFCSNVWHEIDDRNAALAEMARVLRSEGRVAIVDWRPDCASPPGPPTDHRLSAADVSEQLQRAGWREIAARNIGAYSYLVTGVRPASPP